MVHALKAADVPDEAVMAVIRQTVAQKGHVGRIDVLDHLPQYPRKVLYAKMRSMVKRGLIDTCSDAGCNCGSLIFPGSEEW
jgi:hypothetical protein